MKAVYMNPQQSKSLLIKDVGIQVPKENEVLVRVKAVSLNHRDLFFYHSVPLYPDFHEWNEFIVCADGFGIIESVGNHVKEWAVGDRVVFYPVVGGNGYLGGPNNGTLAEYITIAENQLIKVPPFFSDEEAASFPVALSTAWNSLVTKGNIKKDEFILIPGIGGGVALFSMLLAKSMGANVIVTSSSYEKLEKAKRLGADYIINYKQENVLEKVMNITQDAGVDLVIDGNGVDSLTTSIPALKQGGRVIIFGATSGPMKKQWLEEIQRSKEIELIMSGTGSKEELIKAIYYMEDHQIKPVIWEKVFSMNEVEKAYEAFDRAEQFGKVIIKL